MVAATAANVETSVGVVSNKNGLSSRVAAAAPAVPSTTPAAPSHNVPRSTIQITDLGRAPSAIRTPISWVRWATEYASTP